MKKTSKYVTGIIFLLLVNFTTFSQNLETVIKIKAMEMANALIKNDFATFSKYLPPKIIEFAGGKEKLKNKMDSADATMKQFGIAFKKILIGNPGEIINYKNQLQCVVPQNTDMQTPMGELNAETSLIAISSDKGKNWYFVDTNIYRSDKLKTLLPDLSPQLVIPPQKQPKFTPTAQDNH